VKYCSNCGAKVTFKDVEDDHRQRYVCDSCETVHYQNPNVVVGSLPIWDGKILLARRGITPRSGYWNLPAGFLENQETVEEGVKRELFEETEAKIENLQLYGVYSVPRIDQVHIYYRAELTSAHWALTPESTEIMLCSPDDIPWDMIAFPSTLFMLERYVEDLAKGSFGVHQGHFVMPKEWEKLLKK